MFSYIFLFTSTLNELRLTKTLIPAIQRRKPNKVIGIMIGITRQVICIAVGLPQQPVEKVKQKEPQHSLLLSILRYRFKHILYTICTRHGKQNKKVWIVFFKYSVYLLCVLTWSIQNTRSHSDRKRKLKHKRISRTRQTNVWYFVLTYTQSGGIQ